MLVKYPSIQMYMKNFLIFIRQLSEKSVVVFADSDEDSNPDFEYLKALLIRENIPFVAFDNKKELIEAKSNMYIIIDWSTASDKFKKNCIYLLETCKLKRQMVTYITMLKCKKM